MELFRYYVYGKRVNLLTEHALELCLKRNNANKQYSARLTRWLNRLNHFDVNAQNTAGENITLTEYLGRHRITYTGESAIQNRADCQKAMEAEEKFVNNQIYGLFDFNRTVGSITQFFQRTTPAQRTDQSQRGKRTRGRNRTDRSLGISSNSINVIHSDKHRLKVKMDEVNDIDMEFIFKKQGHFPETHKLRLERTRIVKADKFRIVGKGRDNERIQEIRPSYRGRKQFERSNIEINNKPLAQLHSKNINKIITSAG